MPQFSEPHIAQLSQQQLAKLQELEKKLSGAYVVAFEPQRVVPAQLTPEQLQALQQAERDLGACLVAYRKA